MPSEHLSIKCEFKELLDQALHDRFVCSVCSEAIQTQLITKADLTKAQEIVQGTHSDSANYGRFIPNLSSLIHPLNNCCSRALAASCQQSFQGEDGVTKRTGTLWSEPPNVTGQRISLQSGCGHLTYDGGWITWTHCNGYRSTIHSRGICNLSEEQQRTTHDGRIAPYHPATNGLDECVVQSLKQGLRASLERAPRTRFNLLRPDQESWVRARQKADHDYHSRQWHFTPGNLVMARNYCSGPDWILATTSVKLGPLLYLVETAARKLWRRHVDQLKKWELPPVPSSAPDTQEPSLVPKFACTNSSSWRYSCTQSSHLVPIRCLQIENQIWGRNNAIRRESDILRTILNQDTNCCLWTYILSGE